jgi:hypothetical protein
MRNQTQWHTRGLWNTSARPSTYIARYERLVHTVHLADRPFLSWFLCRLKIPVQKSPVIFGAAFSPLIEDSVARNVDLPFNQTAMRSIFRNVRSSKYFRARADSAAHNECNKQYQYSKSCHLARCYLDFREFVFALFDYPQLIAISLSGEDKAPLCFDLLI